MWRRIVPMPGLGARIAAGRSFCRSITSCCSLLMEISCSAAEDSCRVAAAAESGDSLNDLPPTVSERWRMEQKAVDILNTYRLMAIATLRPDGWPQATMVSYANDGLLLYFVV